MDNAVTATVALTVILLAAALLVVWSRRNINTVRAAAIPLALAAALGSGAVVASTLGYAVPLIGGITAPAGELNVLAVKLLMNKGIYITLDLPDQPKLYWMPWDTRTAEKLQEMMEGENGGVLVDVPAYEWSWDLNEPSFRMLPPPPKVFPDKPPEENPAPHFAA